MGPSCTRRVEKVAWANDRRDFGAQKNDILDTKTGPKVNQNLLENEVRFNMLFFGVFTCVMPDFLAIPTLSYKAWDPKKHEKL